jgi:predicted PurR-regulated permease PerM
MPPPDRWPPALVFKWGVAGSAGALVVLAIAYGLYSVRGILVLVLVALFVAVSLDPAVRWLVRRGIPRPLAVSLVILLLVALFTLFLWSLVPPVVRQSGTLADNLPSYLNTLAERSRTLRELGDRYHLTDRLTSLLGELPGRLAGGAAGFLQALVGTLASLLTILVLSIYFMADMPRIERGLVHLFPRHRRAHASRIASVVIDKVGSYMIGNLAISLIAGTASYLCFWLVGVPYALPLAIAVAITDLIPLIGATLGAVIGTAVSVLTVGFWPRAVIVLLFLIGYQQIENYVIQPRIMRNAVDLSPVAVLLVALIGGTVLGLVGALMAIPIAAAAKVVMSPMLDDDHPPDPDPDPPDAPDQPEEPEPAAPP